MEVHYKSERHFRAYRDLYPCLTLSNCEIRYTYTVFPIYRVKIFTLLPAKQQENDPDSTQKSPTSRKTAPTQSTEDLLVRRTTPKQDI